MFFMKTMHRLRKEILCNFLTMTFIFVEPKQNKSFEEI